MRKMSANFSLNSFVAPKEDWYKELSLQDSIDMAKEKLVSTAENFVAIGYYLKHIRDKELYKDKGYQSIWECADRELKLSQSTASRYINICEKFSNNGDSPYLADNYKEYGKSQLQELLAINDQKLIEQVTPNMSVKQIKDLKKSNRKDKPIPIPLTKEDNTEYKPLIGQMEIVVEDGSYRELESKEEVTDCEYKYNPEIIDILIERYQKRLKALKYDDECSCILEALILLKRTLEG